MTSALTDTGGGWKWQRIVRRVLATTPPECAICGQGDLDHLGPNYRWSVDHIIPRADFGPGNADIAWNLQRVHLACNARKSARRTAAKKRAKKNGQQAMTATNPNHHVSRTVKR